MPTFQKIETVEARKYDGPKLTVVSDALGEQIAVAGDYLLGTERGKVTVVSAAKFEAEYKPYSETPADDQLKADEQALAILKAELAAEQGKSLDLANQVAALSSGNQALLAEKADADALKAEVANLKVQLEAANAQKAADEEKLAQLTASLNAFTEAQAKADAAQEAVNKALNS